MLPAMCSVPRFACVRKSTMHSVLVIVELLFCISIIHFLFTKWFYTQQVFVWKKGVSMDELRKQFIRFNFM